MSLLNQVYFFAKFSLSNDCLNEKEFTEFCELLVDKGILDLIKEEQKSTIGYATKTIDFIDNRYFVFGKDSDTIKQWLQISSEGKYRFEFIKPEVRYFSNINNELVVEKKNVNVIFEKIDVTDQPKRISEIIKLINSHNYDIKDESFHFINILYKLCKLLNNSCNPPYFRTAFLNTN